MTAAGPHLDATILSDQGDSIATLPPRPHQHVGNLDGLHVWFEFSKMTIQVIPSVNRVAGQTCSKLSISVVVQLQAFPLLCLQLETPVFLRLLLLLLVYYY